jgi:hypothetical protein
MQSKTSERFMTQFGLTLLLSFVIGYSSLANSEIITPNQVNPQSAEAPLPPAYEIEVIIFENLEQKGWTEEYWPQIMDLPDTQDAFLILEEGLAPIHLKSIEKQMDSQASILNRKGMRVLYHEAWAQFTLHKQLAPKVLIEAANHYGASLLGTLQFYKNRFNHVAFDLLIERRIPEGVKEGFSENQGYEFNDIPEYWRFAFKDSRKIKQGELHYLDHPLMGILVKIEKFDGKVLMETQANTKLLAPDNMLINEPNDLSEIPLQTSAEFNLSNQ